MTLIPQYQSPPPVPYRPGNGKAVASMVLGITSVVFCWWGLATLAMVVLAIALGGTSMKETKQARVAHHGMAVAGLVLGIVGALIYIILGIASLGVMLVI